jgi:predicted Na+-dependent transporter
MRPNGWPSRPRPEPIAITLFDGVRAGVALGLCIVGLAILGLTPSFAWIPEVLLIAVAILLPIATYGLTGYRAGKRTGRSAAGAIAGGVAGGISGAAGGLSYVAFGKPILNVAVGLVVGTVGGAIVGALAAAKAKPGF